MPRVYDRPQYVLPFDRRASFQKVLFGWSPPLDAAQGAQVAGAWRAGTLSADGASRQIERRFRDFIHLFEATAHARAA